MLAPYFFVGNCQITLTFCRKKYIIVGNLVDNLKKKENTFIALCDILIIEEGAYE